MADKKGDFGGEGTREDEAASTKETFPSDTAHTTEWDECCEADQTQDRHTDGIPQGVAQEYCQMHAQINSCGPIRLISQDDHLLLTASSPIMTEGIFVHRCGII